MWLCGDLHLENFGGYGGDNRCTCFDCNDLDEACLGPAGWDLARLLTSAAIEAAEREWRPRATRELCEAVLDSYAGALTGGKARWVERETAEGIVDDLFQVLSLRTGQTLVDRLIRKDGVKALPLSSERESKHLAALVESLGGFRYRDAARRIAGVQGMVQEIPPAFLRPIEFEGHWWILRELMPSEERVAIARCLQPQVLRTLVAWGHLRSGGRFGSATTDELIKFGAKRAWRGELARYAVGFRP